MSKALRVALCALAIAIVALPVFGQTNVSSSDDFTKVGAAGGQFLKIGVGARAMGMAGAYSGAVSDITALHWNPAGIAGVEGLAANFSYTQWFADLDHNFMAIAVPVSEQFSAAIHVITFSSGDIEQTTVEEETGTGAFYNLSDLAIGITFGGSLTEKFSFGVTGKYVEQGLSNVSGNGFVFDIGTMYELGIENIRLGFAITNLGAELRYTGQDVVRKIDIEEEIGLPLRPTDVEAITNPYQLPLSFRAGLAKNFFENDDIHNLLLAVDFETLSDSPEQYAFGAEYTWNEIVALRSGYRIGQDEQGFAGGIGLLYEGGGFKGTLDYSLNDTETFGIINRLSVALDLR